MTTTAVHTDRGAVAAAPTEASANLERRVEVFVALTARLTGFDEYDVRGTGLVTDHLAIIEQHVGAGYLDMLLAAEAGGGGGDALAVEIRDAVEAAIIKLWYVGAWTALPDPVFAALNKAAQYTLAPNSTYIPASEAYLNGLVWRAFEGHPMGGRPPGFGSWSVPPPSLPASVTSGAAGGDRRGVAGRPSGDGSAGDSHDR